MTTKNWIAVCILVALLASAFTLLIDGGVRRAGGVTPYIAKIMGSIGGGE